MPAPRSEQWKPASRNSARNTPTTRRASANSPNSSHEAQQQREQLAALLNESTEGRLYKKLADEIREMEIEIERLRAIANKIDGGLGNASRPRARWMQQVSKAPVHPFVDITHMDEALGFLDSCERSETSNTLSHLANAADQLCKQLRDRFRSDAEELRKLRAEKSDLESADRSR